MADLNIGNSSSNVVVNAKHNGSVIPQINNTYDLGTSALRWKNIYGNLKGNADTATTATNLASAGTWTWTGGTTAGPTASLVLGGKTASIGAIPSASASASGIITTGAQSFGGDKTFNGNVNLTASHGIIFTSTAGGTNTSTPTGLTYSRLQGTSSFSINADTDGSKTEYLILTSGRGMSNSISDGLAIGYDSITWHGNNLWGKYLMKKTTIDASSLNQNTWYPVSIYVPPKYNVRIEIEVALDSGTTPSWSTHSSGFSVRKIWETNGNGWGTIPITRNIYVSTYSFADTDPVRGLTQNTSASVEIVYVRGGGKYFFRTSPEAGTPTLNPSGYSWSGGGNYSYSAPITTTAPAVISAYADITVPRANNATKLATARTISLTGSVTGSGTFDGSGNLSIATTTNHTHAAATTSANGFMSSSDKSKLDGIATGANKYSHPTYTSRASGLYKITVDGTGHVSAATAVAKSDITALGIPSTNTTYSVATTSSNGLMSSSDKTKLNNANINVYKMSNIDTVAKGSSNYVDIGFCSGYNTSSGGTYICISISWQGYAIQFRMGQGASTVKTRCTNTSKQWTSWH